MTEYKQLINDVYEKDGTLYIEKGDEYIPLEANLDCYSSNEILSRENVREMSYEVDTNSEISHVSLPSDKLEFELRTNCGFGENNVNAILAFFSDELHAADKAAREELVPMEKEKIQHNIDEYTKWAEDIQLLEGREWSPEEMVETFIKRIHIIPEWKPQFHSYNEVREICRDYLKGE